MYLLLTDGRSGITDASKKLRTYAKANSECLLGMMWQVDQWHMTLHVIMKSINGEPKQLTIKVVARHQLSDDGVGKWVLWHQLRVNGHHELNRHHKYWCASRRTITVTQFTLWMQTVGIKLGNEIMSTFGWRVDWPWFSSEPFEPGFEPDLNLRFRFEVCKMVNLHPNLPNLHGIGMWIIACLMF